MSGGVWYSRDVPVCFVGRPSSQISAFAGTRTDSMARSPSSLGAVGALFLVSVRVTALDGACAAGYEAMGRL